LSVSARAEVLDKVLPPWDPTSLLPALVVLVFVCLLAASSRPNLRTGALVLAVLWAAFRLGTDEWFSADVGPILQVELPLGEARKWFYVILLEALTPIALAIGIVLVRLSNRNRRT